MSTFFDANGLEYTINDGNVSLTNKGNFSGALLELTTSVTNPSNGDPYDLTSIGDGAFATYTNLTSITIPEGVTYIGEDAFANCINLPSLSIPSSVTFISNSAFQNCNSITSITVGPLNQFYSYDTYALYNIDKTTILKYFQALTNQTFTIPSSVTTIGNNAFYDCNNLTSMSIPSSVTTIGYQAFTDCNNLTSISIPSSVTSIGDSVFVVCPNLTSITIPSSVTYIGSYVCGKESPFPIYYYYNASSQYIPTALSSYSSKLKVLPNAPTDLQVQSSTPSSVTISFTPSSDGNNGVTNYQYSTNGGTTFSTLSPSSSTSPITITGLSTGSQNIILRGMNNNTNSATIFGLSSSSLSVTITSPGAGGDPHITTIFGEKYDLPNIEGKFLLFDNNDKTNNFKLICECKFLTDKEKQANKFSNLFTNNGTFMTKLWINYNNMIMTVDLNTLELESNIVNSVVGKIYSDINVFEKYYSFRKKLKYHVNFNGKSREISVGMYKIKVSVDLNCSDHRNEIIIMKGDLTSGSGALMSSKCDSLLEQY